MLLPLRLNLETQAQVAWLQVSAPLRLGADTGAFVFTGLDAALTPGGASNRAEVSWVQVAPGGVRLTADTGVFTLTGQDAGLIYVDSTLRALVSWLEVGSRRDIAMPADGGSFLLAFAPSLSDFAVTGEAGAFTMAGGAATLSYSGAGTSYSLPADTGAFVLTGIDAGLVASGPASYVLACSSGAFLLVGTAVTDPPATRPGESLDVFFDPAFAVLATSGSMTAFVMLDAPTEDIMGGRVLTDEYRALCKAADLPGIGRSATLSIDGGTYTVREVRLLDDGALKELLLTRTGGSRPSTFSFEADLGVFFDARDFAVEGRWLGVAANLLLDQPTEDVLSGRALSADYTAMMRAEDWPGIARGATVSIGLASFVVREVRRMDDGALKSLTMKKP